MNKPLLSIVIPTKDRYYYLKYLLNYLIKLDPENIEIVLQDNSTDNQEFLQYLKGIDYPMLKYDYVKGQIPISLNSDMAVNNSTGKFVCFIGDDDGVTSLIVPCVKYMDKNNVDVVVSEIVKYNWPDSYNAIKGTSGTSSLKYKDFSGIIKKVDTKDVLDALMRRGCLDRGELPLLYHGIVRRSVLDKIYEKGHTYFPGPSPDIANGIALSLLDCNYVRMDIPVVISGASKHHGGGVKQMKNRAANIEDVPFLPPKAKENWETKVPRIWTGETVWCESSIKAMRYMDRDDLVERVNFDELYATFIAFHWSLRGMAFPLTNHKTKVFFKAVAIVIKRYYNVLLRILHVKKSKQCMVRELDNIETVMEYMSNKYAVFADRFSTKE